LRLGEPCAASSRVLNRWRMSETPILVFTDGAARGNPGPGGWGAIVAADGEVVELGGGSAHTTNNKMELTAAIRALEHLRQRDGRVIIHTDSSYLIDGITKWIHGWRRKGWKTASGSEVLNRDLWEQLSALVGARGTAGKVSWQHVRGHAGVPGNERADEIATGFADGEAVPLHRGPLASYPVPLDDLGPPAEPRRAGSRPAAKAKAYSYLSLVDGKAMRHATWPECERRVRGVSGARFKKASSAADEAEILRSWGVAL
jgi:ribonuclease HI